MTAKSAVITTPSRIAISLIDLNGEIGRVDGSLGIALQDPGFQIRARGSDGLNLSGIRSAADENRGRIEALHARFRQEFGVGGIDIQILRAIPSHSGLGSGTQLSMAVGKAFDLIYDLALDNEKLAFFTGRGGTSGIGVEAFRAGGFIVDGGHRFGVHGGKQAFAPSAASLGLPTAPILFRESMPADWRVVLASPAGRIVHGSEESRLFDDLCPIPRGEAAEVAHLTLLKVMPAILENDLDAFGEGIEAIQRVGFKRHEIAYQDQVVRDTMDEMRRLGLRGVGMGTWGPTVFGFSDAPDVNGVIAGLEEFGRQRGGTVVWETRASQTGAVVEME